MKIKDSVVKAFRSLPEWVKKEVNLSANVGWLYSGNDLIGWSWSPQINSLAYYVDLDEADYNGNVYLDYSEKVIPSEPQFYITMIKDLISTFSDASTLKVDAERKDESNLRFFIKFNHEDEDVCLEGIGSDSIETLINLLSEVAEYYWAMECPSLSSINSDNLNLPAAQAFFEFVKNCEIDIFEDHDGAYSISFENNHTAKAFASKYHRFILEAPKKTTIFTNISNEQTYHGLIQMMEGPTRVYSKYGEEDSLNELFKQLSDPCHKSIQPVWNPITSPNTIPSYGSYPYHVNGAQRNQYTYSISSSSLGKKTQPMTKSIDLFSKALQDVSNKLGNKNKKR